MRPAEHGYIALDRQGGAEEALSQEGVERSEKTRGRELGACYSIIVARAAVKGKE